VYREAGLCLKRKKRRHCVRAGLPQQLTTAANQEWALDFIHDVIAAGRTIRVLSVVDAFTRECLAPARWLASVSRLSLRMSKAGGSSKGSSDSLLVLVDRISLPKASTKLPRSVAVVLDAAGDVQVIRNLKTREPLPRDRRPG
jgi:transposase InsO family protein